MNVNAFPSQKNKFILPKAVNVDPLFFVDVSIFPPMDHRCVLWRGRINISIMKDNNEVTQDIHTINLHIYFNRTS